MKNITIYCQKISSPIGLIYIQADNKYLRSISFSDKRQNAAAPGSEIIFESNPIIQQAAQQLRQYFAHKRITFDLPITLIGTEFQRKTWQFLLTIPYGETRSYLQQAQAIGNPKAVRAVGRANGLNPVAIVVPCHRIIRKSGKLSGYAGGFGKKFFLLNLERKKIQE